MLPICRFAFFFLVALGGFERVDGQINSNFTSTENATATPVVVAEDEPRSTVLLEEERGDSSCPCLTAADGELAPLDVRDRTSPKVLEDYGPQVLEPSSTYGIGCHAHDIETPLCQDSLCSSTKYIVPSPLGCDNSWCKRSWCFVDPKNCSLSRRSSDVFVYSDRHYSYATCGDMDAFTNIQRFQSLEGQTFKVGLNSNSGGWMGAYSSAKEHFEGPFDRWSGLSMDFVVQAAFQGKFQLELSRPPASLWNGSVDYFHGDSQFDYCVYATALGYLDMCIAQYTITNQRASSTDWLLLGSAGIYLAVNTDDSKSGTFSYYLNSVGTIFSPFTTGTWMFVILFIIPLFGILMVIHERGQGGSMYPTEEVMLITDADTGESKLKKQHVPWYRSIIKSIYISFLAVLAQSYEPSVITMGAKLNLIGILFFILTIVAVYTANLAAILTQNAQQISINNLEDAIQAGYRFCAERKNMESVINLVSSLDSSMFVVDPIEEGGDGLPGFSCSSCASRVRVFDNLDPFLAKSNPRYCHASIAPEEDLDSMHAASTHCNKTLVGKPIQMIQTGMPIFENVSPQLISFFLKLKNEGLYDQALFANKPNSKCTSTVGGEENALSVAQLSGIWVVAFGFAFLGLLSKCRHVWKGRQQKSEKIEYVHERDQRGQRVDSLGLEDAWMTGGLNHGGRANIRRASFASFSGAPLNIMQDIEKARKSSGPLLLSGPSMRLNGSTTFLDGSLRRRSNAGGTSMGMSDNSHSDRHKSTNSHDEALRIIDEEESSPLSLHLCDLAADETSSERDSPEAGTSSTH